MSAVGSQRVRDANGFFEIPRNPISRVGVFPYSKKSIQYPGWESDPAGIVHVYRPESALNDPETLNSFRLLPWVDDHTMLGDPELDPSLTPPEQKGVHGTTGESISYDPNDRTMYANLKLWSPSLAAAIDAGKKDLSLGYRCVYDYTPGVFEGQRYDAIQTQLRGNHNATVQYGRMGPGVSVLDSAFQFAFDASELKEVKNMKVARRINIAKKLGVSVAALAAACGMDGAAPEELKRWNTAMDAEEDATSEEGGNGDISLNDIVETIKSAAEPLGELQAALADIAGGGAPAEGDDPDASDMEPVLDDQGAPVMDASGKPKMKPKTPPVAPAAGAAPVPPQLKAADSAIRTIKAVLARAKTMAKGRAVTGMDAMESQLRAVEATYGKISRQHAARSRSNPTVAALDSRLASAESTIKKVITGMDSKTVIKDAMKEIAARDKLANHVSSFVGAFDSSEMTELEVAKYAIGKLSIPATDGAEVAAVKAYLHGRQPEGSAPARREGSGEDSFGAPASSRKDVLDFVSGRVKAA